MVKTLQAWQIDPRLRLADEETEARRSDARFSRGGRGRPTKAARHTVQDPPEGAMHLRAVHLRVSGIFLLLSSLLRQQLIYLVRAARFEAT